MAGNSSVTPAYNTSWSWWTVVEVLRICSSDTFVNKVMNPKCVVISSSKITLSTLSVSVNGAMAINLKRLEVSSTTNIISTPTCSRGSEIAHNAFENLIHIRNWSSWRKFAILIVFIDVITLVVELDLEYIVVWTSINMSSTLRIACDTIIKGNAVITHVYVPNSSIILDSGIKISSSEISTRTIACDLAATPNTFTKYWYLMIWWSWVRIIFALKRGCISTGENKTALLLSCRADSSLSLLIITSIEKPENTELGRIFLEGCSAVNPASVSLLRLNISL